MYTILRNRQLEVMSNFTPSDYTYNKEAHDLSNDKEKVLIYIRFNLLIDEIKKLTKKNQRLQKQHDHIINDIDKIIHR